ncbi:MAG: M15 family metallopeptidase [Aureispira sp.]|nr:M15 family metallopeptidase [Aureispira sp.]
MSLKFINIPMIYFTFGTKMTMILICRAYMVIFLRFLLILFFLGGYIGGTFGQNCEKNWMYYEYRKSISEEAKLKYGIDVPIDKIQVDFLGLPIGVRYHYSKVYRIGDRPTKKVTRKNKRSKKQESFLLLEEAYDNWIKLKKIAAEDDIILKLNNSYRSYITQKALYQRLGRKLAEEPGYSEHHLGTTIDLYKLEAESADFLWLLRYAFDYGWVPSYYFRVERHIKQEAWHWRYVGKLAAQKFKCAWEIEINQKIWRLKELYR